MKQMTLIFIKAYESIGQLNPIACTFNKSIIESHNQSHHKRATLATSAPSTPDSNLFHTTSGRATTFAYSTWPDTRLVYATLTPYPSLVFEKLLVAMTRQDHWLI